MMKNNERCCARTGKNNITMTSCCVDGASRPFPLPALLFPEESTRAFLTPAKNMSPNEPTIIYKLRSGTTSIWDRPLSRHHHLWRPTPPSRTPPTFLPMRSSRPVGPTRGKPSALCCPISQPSHVCNRDEDTSNIIRVTFCSMTLWSLHMIGHTELRKILDHSHKRNFLIYFSDGWIQCSGTTSFQLSTLIISSIANVRLSH